MSLDKMITICLLIAIILQIIALIQLIYTNYKRHKADEKFYEDLNSSLNGYEVDEKKEIHNGGK